MLAMNLPSDPGLLYVRNGGSAIPSDRPCTPKRPPSKRGTALKVEWRLQITLGTKALNRFHAMSAPQCRHRMRKYAFGGCFRHLCGYPKAVLDLLHMQCELG